jgi:hypothetical protein
MGSADALSASHRSLQKRNAYSRGVLTAGLQTVERAMEKISGAPILPKTQESIARMRRGVVVVAAAGRCFGQLSEIATPFCEGDAIGACWRAKRGEQSGRVESRGSQGDALSVEESCPAQVRGGRELWMPRRVIWGKRGLFGRWGSVDF